MKPKGEGLAAEAEKILLAEVDDYRIAYLSGGDSAALKQYNQQYDVAKKLMYKYMTVNGMDSRAAAERVRNEIFPEYNNVVNTPSGQFIVPTEFNGQTIEILSNQLLTFNKLTELNIKELDMTDYPKDVSEVISLQSLATRGVWL